MSRVMTAMIVDDEPLARENLRRLLSRVGDVDIVAEVGDVEGAVSLIRARRPDLLLLDVRIRDGNGFEVLDRIDSDESPEVIFVSAHDEHAVRAFAVRAVDYLLKPIEAARLRSAVERAREHLALRNRSTGETSAAARANSGGEDAPLVRFLVRSVGKILLIDVSEVDWIEAAGNYVRLHHGGESHLLRETMTALEARLDRRRFVRIHRSTIVNLDRVRELRHILHGDYVVELRDGKRLTLSRGFREQFQQVLESAARQRVSN